MTQVKREKFGRIFLAAIVVISCGILTQCSTGDFPLTGFDTVVLRRNYDTGPDITIKIHSNGDVDFFNSKEKIERAETLSGAQMSKLLAIINASDFPNLAHKIDSRRCYITTAMDVSIQISVSGRNYKMITEPACNNDAGTAGLRLDSAIDEIVNTNQLIYKYQGKH